MCMDKILSNPYLNLVTNNIPSAFIQLIPKNESFIQQTLIDCWLFNVKWQIFRAHSGREQVQKYQYQKGWGGMGHNRQ